MFDHYVDCESCKNLTFDYVISWLQKLDWQSSQSKDTKALTEKRKLTIEPEELKDLIKALTTESKDC